MVVVKIQQEQDADLASSGHVSLIPGVPGGSPWSGNPKGRVMLPLPRSKVDQVYRWRPSLKLIFTGWWMAFTGCSLISEMSC